MPDTPKKTPEQIRQQRIASLAKARERQAQQRQTAAASEFDELAGVKPAPFVEAEGGEPVVPKADPIDEEEAEGAIPAGLDREIWMSFTIKERAEIWAEANAMAKAEIKAERKAKAREAALVTARENAGLVPEDEIAKRKRIAQLNETVYVEINLPEGGGDGIRLDQRMYRHGVAYHVPRVVGEMLWWMMGQAWMADAVFEGKRRSHYNRFLGRFESPFGTGGVARGMRQYERIGVVANA